MEYSVMSKPNCGFLLTLRLTLKASSKLYFWKNKSTEPVIETLPIDSVSSVSKNTSWKTGEPKAKLLLALPWNIPTDPVSSNGVTVFNTD